MKLLPWEYAVRNLGRSPLRLALSVAGSVLVVLLVLTAGAFVRGMANSLKVSGGEKNVILVGAGSEESVERSEIKASAAQLVLASVPGIRQRLGVAYVSPEVHMQTAFRENEQNPAEYRVILRGMETAAFLVHAQVRITAGRAPEPGRDELLVGSLAGTKMGLPASRLAIGKQLYFDKRQWAIVGTFEAPGAVMDSEIWCPLRDLQIAAKRDNLSCVILTLDTAEFADVDAFAKQRLDLELVALPERAYYGKLMTFYRPIQIMVWVTALLIAMGGLFGGLNTMYAAFAARVRELGSLQAIGFSRRAIVLSLIQESALATAAGAIIASLAALFLLDGLAVRFSMGAFGLSIDSTVLSMGLAAGLFLGVAGALPPAWRCLRLPITDALRAS